MRLAEGAIETARNVGIVHRLTNGPWALGTRITSTIQIGTTRQDLEPLACRFRVAIDAACLDRFATNLGVSTDSLRRLDLGRNLEGSTWAFPMRDAKRQDWREVRHGR